MSCHTNIKRPDNRIFICTSPIMGFTPEKKWIEDEKRIFGERKKTIIKKQRPRLTATKEELEL